MCVFFSLRASVGLVLVLVSVLVVVAEIDRLAIVKIHVKLNWRIVSSARFR